MVCKIQKNLDAIVEFAEVSQFLDTPVKRYSSGMFVRLAFAVAAHSQTEILIVDEVLAVGDSRFQKKCINKMSEVGHTGSTVLFVSHNPALLQSFCTRGILLESGKLVKDGPLGEVLDLYQRQNTEHHLATEEGIDLSSIPRQRGLTPTFQKMRLTSAEGERLTHYDIGSRVALEFDCHFAEAYKHVVAIVRFSHPIAGNVFTFNTLMQFRAIHEVSQKTTFRAEFDIPALLPGGYYISLLFQNDGATIDEVVNAGEIEITPHDFYGRRSLPSAQEGVYLVKADWSLKS